MKTLNDILVCKLKWIEIELKLNSIEFKLVEWNINSIKEKWDANWCKRYWNFAHDYGVKKFKKKTQIQKYTFPFLFAWESPNWFNLEQRTN